MRQVFSLQVLFFCAFISQAHVRVPSWRWRVRCSLHAVRHTTSIPALVFEVTSQRYDLSRCVVRKETGWPRVGLLELAMPMFISGLLLPQFDLFLHSRSHR